MGVIDPLRMYKDCRRLKKRCKELEERWTSIKSEIEDLLQE